MKNIKNIILNLIYPPKCIFCGEKLSPKVNLRVCSKCANNLPYCRVYNRCRHCGRPMADVQGKMCQRCRLRHSYITRLTSAFVYTDNARQAVIRFKKEYNSFMAKTLSLYVAEMVKYDFGGAEIDLVISVPERKKGIGEKSYNQSEVLARAVALRLGLPYRGRVLLQKNRIRKQSTLTYGEREGNVKDNFITARADLVKGKTVLIADDVCTTGATLEECAKTLKSAGAHRIYASTIASVPELL